jgi:membrane protein DedA with SNARE-associated domain
MLAQSIPALLDMAGHSSALQALAIVLGTFVLEDAATVLAALRTTAGDIAPGVALVSLYVGIVLGDLGLYGLGHLARRLPALRRWLGHDRVRLAGDWLDGRVFKVVLISRFLPGARLPTYTACGNLGCNLRQFAMAAVVATLAWTSLLFAVSLAAGHFIIAHMGTWQWAGAIGLALTPVVLSQLAARHLRAQPAPHN